MPKVVLVTGSSGFCGSFITEYFENKKESFTVFRTSRKKNDHSLHIFQDLLEPLPQNNFPSKIDCIIHCAASVDETDSTYSIIDNNLRSSFHVMKFAVATKTKCFINLSSISVYGKQSKEKEIDEKIRPHPQSSYGLSKLLVEEMSQSLLSKTMNVLNLRIGYAIGPNLPLRYIISRFKKWLNSGESIKLINPYTTRISFVDLVDIAQICEKAIKENYDGIYNVVGDDPPTIRETFEEIKKYFPNSNSKVTEIIDKENKFPFTFSNTKLKKDFGILFTDYHDSFKRIFERK